MQATRRDMLDGLVRHGLLIPTGIPGVFGSGRRFEDILAMLDARITALGGADGAEMIRFPPVTSASLIEQCGYLTSFPHFLGMVHGFCGDEKAHLALVSGRGKKDLAWSEHRAPLEVVLTPAACYPVYPILARRGAVPADGYLVDVASYCFRNEPSDDPARLQAFRLREFVRVGSPAEVAAFRDMWQARASGLIEALSLTAEIVAANDPFFGSQRNFLIEYQNENRLKFEMQIGITAEDGGTACMSFNCHLDHFARACDLRDGTGAFVHSGCVGFGMERLALALIAEHGFEVAGWLGDLLV